jgi:thymidylate synthase
MHTLDEVWLSSLTKAINGGAPVSPRGQPTLELASHQIMVDMRYPVLTVPQRKLSYKFMAAEALWIMDGDDALANIRPWNERMAEFSDDGVVLAGAYGPPAAAQFQYVLRTLLQDPDTRQATLTLWKPNPPVSKDIPCTIALDYKLRNGELHCHAFMRSSDLWLGLPYDVFTFSMMAIYLCSELNEHWSAGQVAPGNLYLTAASSHLYDRDWEKAVICLLPGLPAKPLPAPPSFWVRQSKDLEHALTRLREGSAAHRWWQT